MLRILRTLLSRSWLIGGGVALGLLARWLWLPAASTESEIVFPQAQQAYQELLEQQQRESIETAAQQAVESAGDAKLREKIGDLEILR